VKAIVIGGGSIGMRHLKNLRTLGISQIWLVEPEVERRDALCQEMGIEGFGELDEAFEFKPDFAIVASPNHLHGTQALAVAQEGIHLFIEKPLTHTKDYIKDLADEIDRRNLTSLVGCNMRFHPGPAKVKYLLEQGAIGRPLFARVRTGSYLPDWRPWQDYRESYSAAAEMGGGCLLDCIHEIDLTRWYLGDMESVFCMAGHLSSLDLNVEDVASLICKHVNGSVSEIHLDYIQRAYDRGCQIVGEQGTIYWDFTDGVVRWFDATTDSWKTFDQPIDWNMNDMYLDELKHFIECVRAGRRTILPVSDAVEVMRVVFAAKVSNDSDRTVSTQEIIL